ncbi:MAG: pantoate/beta-alanine ligase [Cyanobacteria bacterium RYN_339]|nr:pantoate/beta-alanine ligase [Cyanobacteria bacterium RYN_339]
MEVLRANDDVRRRATQARQAGETIGLVPTMGFLHAGHRALIERARAENGRVAVSVFVNPTQFGPTEDFARYPRDEDRDLALCQEAGVDWVYAPSVEELYPHGQPGTLVTPPEGLTTSLCGEFRPGHFTGVATVVAKLFALWGPDRAYFGLKDFQQTAVLRRMAADLCFPVALVLAPTIRETDGLALSSRNIYLDPAERQAALAIPRALQAGWEQARVAGSRPSAVLEAAARHLTGMQVQYLSLVDRDSLEPATDLGRPAVLAIAAYSGKTRLIDNVALDGPAPLALAASAQEGVA